MHDRTVAAEQAQPVASQDQVIVSVSGIRGVIGRGLTPELVSMFAAALGSELKGRRLVLSRDSRPSGRLLRHAVLAGLNSVGSTVDDLGIVPTPTCGYAIRTLQAGGGIQITASHNPAEWNGLKLFGPGGTVLTAAEGQRIQQRFIDRQWQHVSWNQLGTVIEQTKALDWHSQRILELVDGGRIGARRFRVFLDANGGAGGPLARQLLEALGTQVHAHGCSSSRSQVDQTLLAKRLPLPHHEDIKLNYLASCPDVLAITFDSMPEQVKLRQMIGPDGRVDLGNLGRLRVEGHNTSQIAQLIARHAGLAMDQVRVEVVEYNSQLVYLFGQVNGLQRSVPFRGQETVLDLLQRVGGITPGAELNDVFVVRANVAEGKQPEIFPVELRDIVLHNDHRTNLRLEPYDQIHIGETRKSRFEKCVPPCFRPVYQSACGMKRPTSSDSADRQDKLPAAGVVAANPLRLLQ